ARLGLAAAPDRAFVADFAAGTGGCARPWRNRGRMVVRFHLDRVGNRFDVRAPCAVGVGKETCAFRTLDHCRVGCMPTTYARATSCRCDGSSRTAWHPALGHPP